MIINNEQCRWIGSGQFCTAYRSISDPTVVYLISSHDDNTRESYSHSEHIHIPEVTLEQECVRIGRRYEYCNIWKMRYYKTISKRDRCWSEFVALNTAWEEIYLPLKYGYSRRSDGNTIAAQEFVELLRKAAIVKESLIDAIERIIIWASCLGYPFNLEFNKPNIGVDESGNLILRDIVY